MGFIDEVREAWQHKAAQLVSDIIGDYEKYIAQHDREKAAKDAVIEAAEAMLPDIDIWSVKDGAHHKKAIKRALDKLKAVQDA